MGGVGPNLKTLFTISMVLAAAGYLIFCYSLFFTDDNHHYWLRESFTVWNVPYTLSTYACSALVALFLISASVWMPATLKYLETSVDYWWITSVASLWITASALIVLTVSIGFYEYQIIYGSPVGMEELIKFLMTFKFSLPLSGIFWIAIHCLVFDAIIWVAKFH